MLTQSGYLIIKTLNKHIFLVEFIISTFNHRIKVLFIVLLIKRAIMSNSITANELKVKGVSILDQITS